MQLQEELTERIIKDFDPDVIIRETREVGSAPIYQWVELICKKESARKIKRKLGYFAYKSSYKFGDEIRFLLSSIPSVPFIESKAFIKDLKKHFDVWVININEYIK